VLLTSLWIKSIQDSFYGLEVISVVSGSDELYFACDSVRDWDIISMGSDMR
jgi:hypothetical protein